MQPIYPDLYPNALAQLIAWFVVDNQGCIIEANEKFCQFIQYFAFELAGQPLSGFLLEPFPEQFLTEVTTPGNGQAWRGEIKIRPKSGNFCWFDVAVMGLKNATDL